MDTKDKRLERVAEELMGRRKWKQYQETLTKSHSTDILNKQSPSIAEEQNIENIKTRNSTEALNIKEENKLMTAEDIIEKLESNNSEEVGNCNIESEDGKEEFKDHVQLKEAPNPECASKINLKPEPVDWKPQDKCYFCVDGKLVKVNEKGELVVESGSAQPEAELIKHITESDESSTSSDTVQKNNNLSQQQFSLSLIQKNLEALLKTAAGVGFDSNMTSLESMAAQIAAFQRMQNNELNPVNPFYPNPFYPFPQVSPTTTPERISSPLAKRPTSTENNSPSPTTITTGEQPLDLSAKPSSSSSDSKNIFKAKPRISAGIPGRRSYTEEELNNALQDILSGKLGTRRAAVLYGIPRSTLRNKVYKLAMEQKRELLANHPPLTVLEEDDDRDSGPEEDKDVTNVVKIGNSNEQLQKYLRMLSETSKNLQTEKKESNILQVPSSWAIDPVQWMQNLILGGMGGFSPFSQPTTSSSTAKEELPDFLRKLLTQPQEMKDEKGDSRNTNNGVANTFNPIAMLNLLQQKNLTRASNTPEMEANEGSDDSSTILKIPSIPKTMFGPGPPSTSSSHSKNGDINNSTPSTSPKMSALSISPQLQSVTQQSSLANRLNLRSPSIARQRSESQSPTPSPTQFNLHDVIRQSISKNFQTSRMDDPKLSSPLTIDPNMEPYQKRPTISVIKNLGGTDISRFGANPNVTQIQQQQLSPNNTGTGGKGTRPKRGKYRNYDRDSLVEAVKAVQRGEMSVHRAGSYYGVPHSTLEYKVKERHLMRPRKREPKPQPLDSTSSLSANSVKRQDIGQGMDKSKTIQSVKPPLKASFTPSNGMKIPQFIDHASMAQLQLQTQLQTQLLWPHSGNFPGLGALDFARSASQSNSSFPPTAESFFAQQMLQKFQEEHQQQFKSPLNGNPSSSANSGNNKPGTEFENIYDTVNSNGSFLDGIIRSTLDKKPSELTQGTLFEQLLKKSTLPQEDDAYSSQLKNANKRPGSPLIANHSNIKKERNSPSPSDTEQDFSMIPEEQPSGVSKFREHLSIKEELNNGSMHLNSDVNS